MENQENIPVTEEALKAFCAAVDEKIIAQYGDGHEENELPIEYAIRVHGFEPTIYESGKKYARIVKRTNGRSAFCFVDLANGNIHKADGWKAPEKKHVRGNIKNGADDVTAYGTVYLR